MTVYPEQPDPIESPEKHDRSSTEETVASTSSKAKTTAVHRTNFYGPSSGPIHTGTGNININNESSLRSWLNSLFRWSEAPNYIQLHWTEMIIWSLKTLAKRITVLQAVTFLLMLPLSLFLLNTLITHWLQPILHPFVITLIMIVSNLFLLFLLLYIHVRFQRTHYQPWLTHGIVWFVLAGILANFAWVTPAVTDSFYRQGIDALENGGYTDALQYLRRATSLSPKDAHTHYYLGNVYESQTSPDISRAIAEYERAYQLNEDFWPAYNNLGRLYLEDGRPDAALRTLHAGLRLVDQIPEREEGIFRKNLGRAYLETGSPTSAIEQLRLAEASLQDRRKKGENISIYLAETYHWLARAYEATNQPEFAKRAWADSLGHALAVRESVRCQASKALLTDCLDAEAWIDAASAALGGF